MKSSPRLVIYMPSGRKKTGESAIGQQPGEFSILCIRINLTNGHVT